MRLAEIADKLDREGIFTGGPPHLFEAAGRMQLATLLREGLQPSSKVLDIGCGCLRAGYWLVRLLDLGCYFGIEPNAQMLDAGIQYVLDDDTRAKRPRFDNNDQFDFSVFGVKFDVFLARSIWTHASKDQIQVMLDGFVRHSTPEAFLLTSYLPARWYSRENADYKGHDWVGKSHTSAKPGMVSHRRRWIEKECESRSLSCRQLDEAPFNGQYWLKITHRQRGIDGRERTLDAVAGGKAQSIP